MSFDQQLEIVKNREGFIAALDQSGGSTPKALRLYGIGESEYSGEDQMYDRIHEMRSRMLPVLNSRVPGYLERFSLNRL